MIDRGSVRPLLLHVFVSRGSTHWWPRVLGHRRWPILIIFFVKYVTHGHWSALTEDWRRCLFQERAVSLPLLNRIIFIFSILFRVKALASFVFEGKDEPVCVVEFTCRLMETERRLSAAGVPDQIRKDCFQIGIQTKSPLQDDHKMITCLPRSDRLTERPWN